MTPKSTDSLWQGPVMSLTACKFGGTSLATRSQVDKCIEIMRSDGSRRFMVVSAPGARHKGDVKVTDLLIRAAAEFRSSGQSASLDDIAARFAEIVPESPDFYHFIKAGLQKRLLNTGADNYEEAVKAFGEYGSACAVTTILKNRGVRSVMLDPLEIGLVIRGKDHGARPDPKCYEKMGKRIRAAGDFDIAVIPGFYGYDKSGKLQTLPRGGSDTSGAVIARAAGAKTYENWTDEDGLKRADPRIVPEAGVIPEMTYEEARELAYMGFKLQDACFEPIRGQGVVLCVRNVNHPDHPGTRIVDQRQVNPEERILGVACEKEFISIGMRKMYIDKEVSFGRKMFSVSEALGLPYEHTLDGVDTASMVFAKKYLKAEGAVDHLLRKLKKACKPEAMMTAEFALLSVAGLAIKNHLDVHARIFAALAEIKAAVRMIDEGADDLSLFIGVDNERADDAVRAIYRAFFPI